MFSALFDTHAHLNFQAFKDDWKEIIDDCLKKSVWMVNVGSQLHTSKKGVEIAKHYERGVYAAVGIHPIHVDEEEVSEEFISLFSSPQVVAVGETGIDFYHSVKNFEKQRAVFLEHIHMAKEYSLPLIIHGRNSRDNKHNSYQEILKILREENVSRAVVHCFSGSAQEAQAFLDLGLFIGVTGIITFLKNSETLQSVVRDIIPLERLVIETDCPYLTPEPFRGKRNQPQYVRYVAEKIAELKGESFERIAKATWQNAHTLYSLNLNEGRGV